MKLQISDTLVQTPVQYTVQKIPLNPTLKDMSKQRNKSDLLLTY